MFAHQKPMFVLGLVMLSNIVNPPLCCVTWILFLWKMCRLQMCNVVYLEHSLWHTQMISSLNWTYLMFYTWPDHFYSHDTHFDWLILELIIFKRLHGYDMNKLFCYEKLLNDYSVVKWYEQFAIDFQGMVLLFWLNCCAQEIIIPNWYSIWIKWLANRYKLLQCHSI